MVVVDYFYCGGDVVEWLTIGELARKTGMPETTIRRYINLFNGFMQEKSFGRSKKYPGEVVVVLEQIYSLYGQGKGTDEIHDMLQQTIPQVITIEQTKPAPISTEVPQVIISFIEAQNSALNAIRGEMEELRKQHLQETRSLMYEIKELKAQLEDKKERKGIFSFLKRK